MIPFSPWGGPELHPDPVLGFEFASADTTRWLSAAKLARR